MSTRSLAPVQRESIKTLRSQTLHLFDLATSEAVLRSEPMPGFRPLLWHLAHIGVFQNYWILQRVAGQPSMNPSYDIYFDPIKTPREEARQLPTLGEIQAYMRETMSRVEQFLSQADMSGPSPRNGAISAGYALDLVLEHERQHQETVAFLFMGLPYASKKSGPPPPAGKRRAPAGEIAVPSVRVSAGGMRTPFVYDNELPEHTVDVPEFLIDADLTTNGEYAEFVESGGYDERRWWSEDGWHWKESTGVRLPLYWLGPPWSERGFFSEGALRADAPVSGVSWYEAQAYAAFRGKRLPSEFEWEVAAGWDPAAQRMRAFAWGDEPANPNYVNGAVDHWGTSPAGAHPISDSALGLRDASGSVWQWTSSDFHGYPGFVAYPYPEYSEVWFDGDHRVSRGGSWFSAPPLLRTGFRNFYRRRFRAAFFGIRCARDAR